MTGEQWRSVGSRVAVVVAAVLVFVALSRLWAFANADDPDVVEQGVDRAGRRLRVRPMRDSAAAAAVASTAPVARRVGAINAQNDAVTELISTMNKLGRGAARSRPAGPPVARGLAAAGDRAGCLRAVAGGGQAQADGPADHRRQGPGRAAQQRRPQLPRPAGPARPLTRPSPHLLRSGGHRPPFRPSRDHQPATSPRAVRLWPLVWHLRLGMGTACDLGGRRSESVVEPRGLEPLTPCLQSRCATNCAMAPGCHHAGRRAADQPGAASEGSRSPRPRGPSRPSGP